MQMDAEIDKRERQAEQLINKDAELYLLREECEKIQKESRAAQQQLRAKLAEATRNITEVKSQHQKQLERLKAQANYLEAEICQEKNNSLLEKTKNQLLELKTAKAVSEATAARAELFKYITAE